MGTIYTHNIDDHMNRYFPGIKFELRPDGKTVDVYADLYELLEVKEHRIKAFIIPD